MLKITHDNARSVLGSPGAISQSQQICMAPLVSNKSEVLNTQCAIIIYVSCVCVKIGTVLAVIVLGHCTCSI